ncbi:RteC protein [Ostertagia ostertagi]
MYCPGISPDLVMLFPEPRRKLCWPENAAIEIKGDTIGELRTFLLIHFERILSNHISGGQEPLALNEKKRPFARLLKLIPILQLINRVQMFFERNNDLFNYYRSGKTIYDDRFFIRSAQAIPVDPDHMLDIDTRFSTSYSNSLAYIKAFERLHGYIVQLINQMDKVNVANSDQHKSNLVFTDPKVGAVEFGYALFAKGACNNGNASLRQIMDVIQFAFNIDLGNYNAMYNQNIRLRKRLERSAYLIALMKSNDGRMDDLDNNPR